MNDLIFKALFFPTFCLVLLQHPGHHVQHVPQAGITAVLHQNLAKTLNEPGTLVDVPVGDKPWQCSMCYQHVLPCRILEW